MRALLIALNLVLLVAIVGVLFFWHPQLDEPPLPGTYAEKLGRNLPAPTREQRAGTEPVR